MRSTTLKTIGWTGIAPCLLGQPQFSSEIAGGNHGNVIGIGMPDIFRFFGQHSKY